MNKADFGHWVTRDVWTFCEAAHLLVGFEPVPGPEFHPTDREDQELKATRAPRWQVADMYDRIKGAATAGKLAFEDAPFVGGKPGHIRSNRVEPKAVIDWARNKGFELPPEIEALRDEARVLTQRRETTLLRVIGALLDVVGGRGGCRNRHPDFASEAELIRHLGEKYDDKRGMGQRNLEMLFAQSKATLKD